MEASLVSKGAGMIAGLELWRRDGRFVLVDTSPDNRFAADVEKWVVTATAKAAVTAKAAGATAKAGAVEEKTKGGASLKASSPKKRKDAKK